MRYYFLFILFILFSCKEKKPHQKNNSPTSKKYSDNFEKGIASFWTPETASKDRFSVVTDPINKNNKVLKVDLQLEDFAAGGKRIEFNMKPKDSFGYLNSYSFRFMLPESFFKKENKQGSYIIHQWHDEPPSGFSWKTNKNKTRPPVYLVARHDDQGNFTLKYSTGLRSGSMNEAVVVSYKKKIMPNVWYTFSNEIFWSLYSKDGYVIPKINNELFINNNKDVHKIKIRNMYNIHPNYFKFGLYRHGYQEHNRSIYFDDFKMETKRVAY